MIDKGRLLAITDGIIAVAATIMVTRLDVPDLFSMENVTRQLTAMLAYVISFAQIFLAWHEHHDAFANATKINHRVFIINSIWLFFITLLPFVTAVAGKNPSHQPSVLLYITILVAIEITLDIECKSIQKLNGQDMLDKDILNKISIISYVTYLIAVLSTFFMPFLALVIIVLLSIGTIISVAIYDRTLS